MWCLVIIYGCLIPGVSNIFLPVNNYFSLDIEIVVIKHLTIGIAFPIRSGSCDKVLSKQTICVAHREGAPYPVSYFSGNRFWRRHVGIRFRTRKGN